MVDKSKELTKEENVSGETAGNETVATKSGPDLRVLGALFIILLFVIIVRVRIIDIPLERDEGTYANNAMAMLEGSPPYDEAYDIKLPGLFAVYAIILTVFGKTATGIHTGLLIFNILTVLLIFYLGKRLYDPITGTMAAACYAILSLSQKVNGFTANAEPLAVLPTLGGIIMLLKALETRQKKDFFLCGLLLGTAFVIKQTIALFIAFSGLYIIYTYIKNRPADLKRCIKEILMYSAGVFAPYTFICIALYFAGVFESFWFWTITWPSNYVSSVPLATGMQYFLMTTGSILQSQLLIWILALAGLLSMIWDRVNRKRAGFIIGFFIVSVLAISVGLWFYTHYFIFLLPVLSILAAIGVNAISRLFKKGDRILFKTGIPVLLITVSILFMIYKERHYLFTDTTTAILKKSYLQNPFAESVDIGNYINERTDPDDKIAVLGSEPQIYFYSKRRSASKHTMMYTITGGAAHIPTIQRELIDDITAARPKYMVYVNIQTSWGNPPSDSFFSWMQNYTSANYDVVGLIELVSPAITNYYWEEAAARRTPPADNWLLVFKRKELS
jgi:4-amino-4-deoxy-L-arabinose transferase-like glycosyltransferase